MADELNEYLGDAARPVGQRTTFPDLHDWYTGYPGSMSWEYNVQNCSYGSVNGDAEMCGCIAENNLKLWTDLYQESCPGDGTSL
jgi:hypothetical protein